MAADPMKWTGTPTFRELAAAATRTKPSAVRAKKTAALASSSFEHKDPAALEQALVRLGVELRYNLRAGRNEMREIGGAWTEMNDRTADRLRREIEERFTYQTTTRGPAPLHYGGQAWEYAVNALMADREVDPVIEWLEQLPEWDGEPRLDELLAGVFRVDRSRTPEKLLRWASSYLCLGGVYRAMRPGAKQDEMPVLIGPQGCGKSTLLQWLLPPEHRADWFCDGLHLAASPRNRAEALQGRLVVEAAEMAGSSRAELESLNAFLSRTDDGMVRLAYRRNPETTQRRCIIVGAANDDACLPNDPTGNRRFVSIFLTGG